MAEFQPLDEGHILTPGYVNMIPGQTIFNLLGSAGTDIANAGATVATTAQGDITMTAATGGGQVTVNGDGSIIIGSGISPTNGVLLIDADANIDINSATADVSIAANGGDTTLLVGVDNNIIINPTTGVTEIFNTSILNFVSTGVITNISTINGIDFQSIFPPVTSVSSAGAGITVSPTTGDVVIGLDSSISVNSISVLQSIVLPGTFQAGWVITTDALGNAQWLPTTIPEPLNVSTFTVSTINGVPYPIPSDVTSVTTGDGNIIVTPSTGAVTVSINTDPSFNSVGVNSFVLPNGTGGLGQLVTADGTGQVAWAEPTLNSLVSTLTAAEYVFTPSIQDVSSITNSGRIDIVSSSDELHLGGLSVFIDGIADFTANNAFFSSITFNNATSSFITNLSSVNGVAYPPSLPADITVSTLTAGDFIDVLALKNISSINGVAYPHPQATYYKSANQNLTSGNTDITFDTVAAWSFVNGYITHTPGSTDFTVVEAGLYQLEFNTVVLVNGATWSTTSNRTINIDITRTPTAEQAIITSSCIQAVQNYGMSVSGTYYLEVGDVINLRLGNTFTSGPAQAVGLANTIDLNTFFTWKFIQ